MGIPGPVLAGFLVYAGIGLATAASIVADGAGLEGVSFVIAAVSAGAALVGCGAGFLAGFGARSSWVGVLRGLAVATVGEGLLIVVVQVSESFVRPASVFGGSDPEFFPGLFPFLLPALVAGAFGGWAAVVATSRESANPFGGRSPTATSQVPRRDAPENRP